jgi:cysteine desulfurase
MASDRTYLDWNATAPLRPEARAAMEKPLDLVGNPSSVHAEGRAARHLVETARAEVAALVGAQPAQVTFTSGATEANTLALNPFFGEATPRDRLFVSAVEHPSVLCGGRFSAVAIEELPVDADGIVELHALESAMARAKHPLVSVMLANNETGVIQPIRAVADIVHTDGGLLHVDAAQGAGRIDCRIDELGADLMSLSAHKLGGPQGVGALIRRGDLQIEPLVKGGGQERGLRAGTENVPAIAGFGAAAAAAGTARQGDALRMARLRDRFEAGLKAAFPPAVIFGEGTERLPNTSLFAVPGLKAETAIISFDLKGIALSSGAACSSGKVASSSVLKAMGVAPELAAGALRMSLGWSTTERDIDNLLAALTNVVSGLLKRQVSPVLAA